LAVFQNRLYAAWKGAGNDGGIYYSSTSNPDGQNWAPQKNIGGVGTGSSVGPSLAVFQNRLYAAWKGAGNDVGIYYSSNSNPDDPKNWAPQKNIAGVGSSVGPSLAVFKDRLYAAWRGAADNQGIWWSSTLDGINWAPQQNIAGVGSSVGPSLAVFKDRLYAAWRGAGDNQGIWWSSTLDGQNWSSSLDGKNWAPQQNISGVGSSVGPSLAVFHDRLYAAWRGAGDNQGIWWSSASSLPPPPTPPPPPPTPPPPPDGCAGLSGDELAICNKHNADRAEHGVPPLTWSADLAKNAQTWVNDCHTDKDKDGNVFFCHQALSANGGCGTDPNYKYGENLSWAYPSQTGVQAVDGWYCEGANNNYSYDNPMLNFGWMHNCADNPNKVNGHFTQIVWKATKFLGCAKHTCTLGNQTGTLWACEYDPAGNVNTTAALKDNVPPPIQGFARVRAATTSAPVQRTTIIISDVDLYDQAGGSGRKIGILRKGQTVALVACRADNWCQVAGGWVWGAFIVRNHSR
jgi:hypothetical protein